MPLPLITPRSGQSLTASLVARAEQKLWQREQQAVQNDEGVKAKKERVTVVLKSAMEIVAEESSDGVELDNGIKELVRAIKAASAVGVLPQLRVQARKILAEHQSEQKRRQRLEEQLERLVRQAEAAHEANMRGDGEVANTSPRKPLSVDSSLPQSGPQRTRALAAAKQKATVVLQQLRQAADDAKRQQLSQDLVITASTLVLTIEQDLAEEDLAEFKLKQLLNMDDPEKIEARLQLAKNRDQAKGPKALKVIADVEARLSKLNQKEQHQRWLELEIETAVEADDAHRLRQLVSQATSLELNVPPSSLTLLHDMETRHRESSLPALVGSVSASAVALEVQKTPRDVTGRIDAFVQRKKDSMDRILKYVEGDPDLKKFDEVRQAISDAKATKVPLNITMEVEKRLVQLEERYGPRLHAEENLLLILKSSELVTFDGVEGLDDGPVLQDMSKLPILREGINDADKAGVSQELLNAGVNLLDRSVAFELQQRDVAENLRDILQAVMVRHDDGKLEELHLAIDQASKCGIPTLHAERELLKLREIQVQREAAEAELREASKGQGAQGKARLAAAIQAAKTAGVSARRLRAANKRMENLEQHYEKCSLVAGNIRRRLPTIDQEPWRFQQIVESAQTLQPWTPELEKLVKVATEQLEKNIALQTRQREVLADLQAILKRIAEGRALGQTCADGLKDDAVLLAQVLPRAKEAKLREDILLEGEEQMRALKREGCQRTVAEHRLRLALNAKDFGEIERSLREVRALGGMIIDNTSSSVAKVDQQEHKQTARLMDSAHAMLRHLGDMTKRRQAAETALLQTIAESDAAPDIVDSQAEGAMAQQGTEIWVREVMKIVDEAKQSGVAATLVEHAKMKIRQKRRERREQVQAIAALKKTLVKKNASTQELMRNMRKVERFHVKPAAPPEDATTQP